MSALAEFRVEVRDWLAQHLVGEFARYRNLGGIGRDDVPLAVQLAWERELADGGWVGLGYPAEFGGRPATLAEEVAFHEEYTRSGAPARLGNVGATLLGPTLLAFGSFEQQRRFIPPIVRAEQHWCQGYSEPDAGSDLAGIRTAGTLDGDQWVIRGQKIWTTLAHIAQWCFVVARTDPQSSRHKGLSFLLAPMDQPGFDVRPIRQPGGSAEFSEIFFNDVRTTRDLVVGQPGDGWRVAMGTLGFERGVGSLGLQLGFERELNNLIALARSNGSIGNLSIRHDLARCWSGLQIMRMNCLRTLAGVEAGAPGPAASVSKLYWSLWFAGFGELAMRVRGASGLVADGSANESGYDTLQQQFLFGRAVTIFAGSSEIQRNVIAESVLRLPR